MKNYLNDFMIDCEYLDTDREFLLDAYDKITSQTFMEVQNGKN
jgi:hypothetical protein